METDTCDLPILSPSPAALAAAVAAIDVRAYERTRNHLQGRVTRLSPFITHGLTSIPALFAQLADTGQLTLKDKLAFEFGWREFFHHVWHRSGDAILTDMRAPLAGVHYADALPADLRAGRTGLAVIDCAVRTLYETGYLHNHARMWLASYTVHLRKVHWRVAADWLYGHLLDGDLASNHLSWQWVAGTFSHKPYLFNADNVARFAPPGWHCHGSALDCSYETLEQIARSNQTLHTTPTASGVAEPLLQSVPLADTPLSAIDAGVRVTLVHPWMLGEIDNNIDTDATTATATAPALRLGVLHRPFHDAFPWSPHRWNFVLTRLRAVTDMIFIGDLRALQPALTPVTEVSSVATLNPGYRDLLTPLCTSLQPAPRHFPDPQQPCRSFSAFWNYCTAQTADTASSPQRNWHR